MRENLGTVEIMKLRTEIKDKLNNEFSIKFTSNDVDHYIYLFKRMPELRQFPKRELMEEIVSNSDFFDIFLESVSFSLNNKKP